ncbi:fibronectin type III domain-containing protein [Paenibacillus sp. MSJ-34]|uniref:fibronectin type III domain-containing protein n=1 Tax=Paenibacillus sp. MSJ-34 TaxID=2841529 RepID=UPI001C119477|nr:fibronectin type III domain-containing protein [Paenibacillus sp. MSJ-34]MBU5444797.1 fibronectin type III domain-containing protein [Paenibacillus sp. MSJ-34]
MGKGSLKLVWLKVTRKNMFDRQWFAALAKIGLIAVMLVAGLVHAPQIVSADSVVAEIDKREPRAAAVNPITNEIYVISNTGNETFKIIDGVTNQATFITQLSGWPLDVAVNPKTNKIYVTSSLGSISNQDIVMVIDRNNQQTSSIWTEKYPAAVAVNPVLNKIYVTSKEGNSLSVIDGETNEVTSTVDLGCIPRALAVNLQTNKVYVTCSGNVVKIINGETGNLRKSVSVGNYSEAIAIDHAANRVYIATSEGVLVINGDSDAIKSTIPYNDYFAGIAVNPITHKIYATGLSSRLVLIIDGEREAIVNTVSVQSKPKNVVVNPVTNKIYVTSIDGVTVIDGDTNNSLGTLAVNIGEGDVPLVVNPVTNKIYAGSMSKEKVFVIDGTSTDISRIGTGNNPRSVAINPFTHKAYVANAGSRDMTIIDLKSKELKVVKTLLVGERPIAAAANPLTNRIYVVHDSAPSFVTVIDGDNDTIVATVPVGGSPSAIAVNPITNQIYVANNQSGSVTVIDGASNNKGTVPVGSGPVHVAVHPLTNKVYVTNSQDGTVSVIDGATKKVTATVQVGKNPKMAAVNEKTNQIYVANSGSNNVTIIDGASNATSTVPAEGQPYAIAVNKKTNKVYVSNFLGRSVTVIDGASLSLTHLPTTYDDYPLKLAVDEGNNKIYVATLNSIIVIDGVRNTLTQLASAVNATDIAVNPATNQVYATATTDQLMTIHQRQTANPLPVQIHAFPNNRLTDWTASVRFTPKNNYAPIQGKILDVYYQLDSMQGAWKKATPRDREDWEGSLDGLTPGMHVLFAMATDGQETKIGSGVGGAYSFYVSSQAAAPTASKPSGEVESGTTVVLATTTAGASIYYTTDGSMPTPGSGLLYYGPIPVTRNMTVKAIAVKAGIADSDVMMATYTIPTAAPSVPSVPERLTSTAGDRKITLSWSAVANADSYAVYKYEGGLSPANSGDWVLVQENITGNTYTVTGLMNYMRYALAVKAFNSKGASDFSDAVFASPAPEPASSVPGAPLNVVAEAGDGQAKVSFHAPENDGGSPILSYTVTAWVNGTATGITKSSDSSPIIITGLTNDTTYTFTIVATNAKGDSIPSAPSNPVTPKAEQPEQVVKPVADPSGGIVPSGTKVTLSTATEGATIYYTSDGSTPTPSSGTLYGEPVFVTKNMTIRAIAVKAGMIESDVMEEHYTVQLTAPSAPENVTSSAGNRQVTLNWSKVAAADSYAVYKYEGPSAPTNADEWILVEGNVTATAYTVSDLTNGTSYVFAVKAINAGGASDFSAATAAVPTKQGFDQNQGKGGYQRGLYDVNAQQPTAFNWTRQSAYPGIRTPVQLWQFTTGSKIVSSPAIAEDGTIYVGSNDNRLYAVRPDGTTKWFVETDDWVESSPVIAADGTVYAGSDDGKLYAVAPNGVLKWASPIGEALVSSPAIAADGTIYIGSTNKNLYAIDPTDGKIKWIFSTRGEIFSSPAIAEDGTIYVGSTDGNLYAIKPDGEKKWEYATQGWIIGNPIIGADGTVYVGCDICKTFFAIKPDGALNWKYTSPDSGFAFFASPAIASDGTLYVGSFSNTSSENKFYAFDPDGSIIWEHATDNFPVVSTPIIAADGTIYVGSNSGKLYAFNREGTVKWTFSVGRSSSSPAIAKDGTVYIGGNNGKLYAISDQHRDTEAPQWPDGSELAVSDITQTSVKLSWPSATDNVRVTGYRIYVNGTEHGTVGGGVNGTTIGGLAVDTTYTFKVTAFDEAGNESEALAASAKTLAQPPDPDTEAPQWPDGSELTVSDITQTSVKLSWPNATDNVGVAGYRIYVDGRERTTVSGNVYAAPIAGLTADTNYTFQVTAFDAEGNESAALIASTKTSPQSPDLDTEVPKWPDESEMIVSDITQTSVRLSWPSATDNVGVAGYRIYVDNVEYKTVGVSESAIIVTGLTAGTSYAFKVTAYDEAGNEGPALTASAKTLPQQSGTDTEAPQWPDDSELTVSDVTQTSVKLSWSSATDNVGVAGYRIYVDNVEYKTVGVSESAIIVTGLTAGTSYAFKVTAYDEAGNEGPALTASAKTLPQQSGTDTEAPQWPDDSELTVSDVTQTSVKLSWSSATDNVGVAGYRIYVDNVEYKTVGVSESAIIVTGLTAGTSYAFKVTAYDEAGNESPTLTASAKTLPQPTEPDTEAPRWPDGSELTVSEVMQTSLKLTWPSATDNVGVTGYRIYVDEVEYKTVGGNENAIIFTGLMAETSYMFKVTAYDTVGNESASLSKQATTARSSSGGGGTGGSGSRGDRVLSSNADLQELQVWDKDKKLEPSPSFAAGTTSYTARTQAEQVEIMVKPAHFAAKVMLKEKEIRDRTKEHLEEGDNTFVLTVQAENGTKKKYTLTIYRETPKPYEPEVHFIDIAGHWAETNIKRAAAKDMISGYPDGTFKPNHFVTRAEFTVMLTSALQLEEEGATQTFIDQDQIGTWAKQAVAQAVQAGLINGYEDGSFRPNAQITRVEIAVMIARALKLQLKAETATGFADDEAIPQWAKGAVEAIRGIGIVDGRGGNRFVPNEKATRAEAAVILLRMIERGK